MQNWLQNGGEWQGTLTAYDANDEQLGIIHQRTSVEPQGEHSALLTSVSELLDFPANHPLNVLTGAQRSRVQMESGLALTGPEYVGELSVYDSAASGMLLRAQTGLNSTLLWVQLSDQLVFIRETLNYGTRFVGRTYGLLRLDSEENLTPVSGPFWPGALADRWYGKQVDFSADGEHLASHSILRRYQGLMYEDEVNDSEQSHLESVELELWAPAYLASGHIKGNASMFGPVLEIAGVSRDGLYIESTHYLNAADEQVVCFEKQYRAGLLVQVRLVSLTAK